MIEEIKNRLKEVTNPASGLSFDKENRFQRIQFEGERLVIEYKRDGISAQEKKVIENQIVDLLSPLVQSDLIFVKTTSESSPDLTKTFKPVAKTQEPAQLKVGHGTVGNKKQVPGIKKIIAIGSGKGGVGKSTFTANLAITLKNLGLNVGVIDADIYGPSMPMIFGKRDEKPRATEEKKILPVDAHGIKLMSFGFFINENDPVIWRGPMLGGVLNQFLFDVDWSGVDYLLIDLPPGTGDVQLSMIQNTHVDGAIIISTPQDVALLDAKKGLEMFKKMNLNILGMVENMSSFICDRCYKEHFIFGEKGVKDVVSSLNTELLGQIPLELDLRLGSDNGIPYMTREEFKDRKVWEAYVQIGKKVINFIDPDLNPEKKTNFFSKILSLGK